MKIAAVISYLESLAPPALQESYDNAGLITGSGDWECTGIICSLDATVEVLEEAMAKKCNLVVAHHPIVFTGVKKINGENYVEQALIRAIKNDIAVYAIHTNLDNVPEGVNGRMAALLQLQHRRLLLPKEHMLKKLFTFIPADKAAQVRAALFAAGGGHIGNYSECSFNAEGIGTFKAGEGAQPYVGETGLQHQEKEIRTEIVFPAWLEPALVAALRAAHPYEEVAFDIVSLSNTQSLAGSGIIGELPSEMTETDFLMQLKSVFKTPVVRHTALLNRKIKKVAVCGGAGSFLISKALAARADVYVTADMKYHEFFEANGRLLITDIGHYESEQFTINLLQEKLAQKFPTFAVLKTGVITNPVHYS